MGTDGGGGKQSFLSRLFAGTCLGGLVYKYGSASTMARILPLQRGERLFLARNFLKAGG